MSQLTHDKRMDVLQRYVNAVEIGDEQNALQIIQEIPLAPHLANALKKLMGADALTKSGFDLSRAEEHYGKNWLN